MKLLLEIILKDNNDKLKFLEKFLSGSTKEEIESKGSEKDQDHFLEMIMNSPWIEDELTSAASPGYVLSKEKTSYWLMNLSAKTLHKVPGGVEIIPVESTTNDSMICMIGAAMFLIPNDQIMCVGWN